MLGIHFWVVHGKEGVPLEWVGDWVGLGHQASVREVSILDVLGQPVLDKLGHLLGDGNLCTLHGVHQTQMPQPVVCNVVLVVLDCGEESLLSPEVLVVEILQALPKLLVVSVRFNIPDNVEEADVLIIHLLHTNCKALIPNVRVRNHIVSSQVKFSTILGNLCQLGQYNYDHCLVLTAKSVFLMCCASQFFASSVISAGRGRSADWNLVWKL